MPATTTAVLAALLLAALLAVASASGAAATGEEFWLLVIPVRCYETFFVRWDLLNVPCLKAVISKGLGYGIIAGSCAVKLPLVLGILRNRGPGNLSLNSVYFELLSYALLVVYNLRQPVPFPFSAYGETLVVSAQLILMVALFWVFTKPSQLHQATVLGTAAAFVGATVYALPVEQLSFLQYAATPVLLVSRLEQIWRNASAKSVAGQSVLTYTMNAAGSGARIFTTLQEVGKLEVLLSNVLATAANIILLVQYALYRNNKTEAKAAPAAGKAAPAKPNAAAAAAKEEEEEPKKKATPRSRSKGRAAAAEEVEEESVAESAASRRPAARRRSTNKA